MWDPNIGLGTVTHQNIGYLFPMGPYYWLMRHARRARLGRAAPLARQHPVLRRRSGCSTCCARCGVRGPGVVVGDARVHAQPYSLDYAARISVILLPWAALPLAARVRDPRAARRRVAVSRAVRARRAGRRQRERDRARLRGHRARCSGSSYAVLGRRARSTARRVVAHRREDRRAHARSRRCGGSSGSGRRAATGSTSCSYTETLETVVAHARCRTRSSAASATGSSTAATSSVPGSSRASDYTQRLSLHPGRATGSRSSRCSAAALVRWRHRAFFVFLTLVGVVDRGRRAPLRRPVAARAAVQGVRRRRPTAGSRCAAPGRAVPLVVLGLRGAARRRA